MSRREKIHNISPVIDENLRAAIDWYAEESGKEKEKIMLVLEKCLETGFEGKYVGESTYKLIHQIAENIEKKLKWDCDKFVRAGAYFKLIKIKVKVNKKTKNTLVNQLISN